MILSFDFAGDMWCLEHDLECLRFCGAGRRSDLGWARMGGLEGCRGGAVAWSELRRRGCEMHFDTVSFSLEVMSLTVARRAVLPRRKQRSFPNLPILGAVVSCLVRACPREQ